MTGARPKVLMLCHRIPYPPDKGDKIRAWHLLQHLRQRFDVALGCFIDDPNDEVHRKTVAAACVETNFISISPARSKAKSLGGVFRKRPLSMAFYDHGDMHDWVTSQRAKADLSLEVAFSSTMAPYLKGASAPTILDMVDADSAKFSAYGEQGDPLRRLIYRREGRLLAEAEAGAIDQIDHTFLVTPEEATLVRGLPGVNPEKIDWFRNGVDTSYWRADAGFERQATGLDIVFTGAMDYAPNIEAVTYFTAHVWPLLRKARPTLQFGIIGARPTKAVISLAEVPGVTVTGRVPDMRPYLAAAKVAVAPLRIARGVQNKVLEAMAMATPVVASPSAITGTGATPNDHVLAADRPTEWVETISDLLDNPDRALRFGEAGAQFIRAECPWAKTLTRLDRVLDSLGQRAAA